MTDVLTATNAGHDRLSSKDISDAAASHMVDTREDLEGIANDKDNSDSTDGVTRSRDHESSGDPTSRSTSLLKSNESNNATTESELTQQNSAPDIEEKDKQPIVTPDTNDQGPGRPSFASDKVIGSEEVRTRLNLGRS